MVKCIEVLPPSKSEKNWAITFQQAEGDYSPICGTLRVQSKRSDAEYLVTEFPTGWVGRGFHLEKIAGGTDAESEAYDCFVAKHGTQHTCDCRGFTHTGACKHIKSLVALIENRWV